MNGFKPAFLVITALLLAAGCAAEVSDEETEVALTAQPYLLGPWDQRYNMYSYVTDHRLKVCITRNPGTTMALTTLQNHISNAVSKWVNAVQPVSTVTLFNTVSFGCPRIDNVPLWDFEVVLSPGTARAHTWNEGMEMFEGEGTNFGRVMLHEFGHAFQLDDTYIEPGGIGCKPNQPSASVMCDSRAFTVLQTDDIRGARQSFREAHPNLYTGPRPFAQPASGRCMDVVAFGTANGSKVQIWDCPFGPTTNQVWKTIGTNKAIIGEGSNKCLEVENFGTHNGARVQIWDCHGGINQQWTISGDGTIRSKQTGKCIDVANFGAANGFGTANGAFLQMWDCIPGAANQSWRMN